MHESPIIPFNTEALDKIFCPHCEEAVTRLQRMTVINELGEVQESGVAAIVQVLGASFYDSLYDSMENPELLLETYSNLLQLFMENETYASYLYLSLLYGLMGEDTPSPFQWLASHKAALARYLELLLESLSGYLYADGFFDTAPEGASSAPDNVTRLTP